MPPTNTQTRRGARTLVVFVLLCGIWGSTWAVIKVGLRDLPPITFVSVRFIVATLVLVLIARVRRARMPRTGGEWWLLAASGVPTFTINYALVFWSEEHISSGLAALLQATIPLFGLLIAHRVLPGEPLTPARLAGVGVGLLGVAVIFSDQLGVGDVWALWGGAGIVFGALAAAYSNVLVKQRATGFDLSVLVAGQMACGLVPLLVVALFAEGNPLRMHWTPTALACVLYLALVGTVAAFILYYWLVRHMDVTTTQLISLVTPVVAVLVGVAFLGERLTWRVALGGLGIFVGIAIIVLRRRRPPRETPETAHG
ncbi:MAG: DMT family transporter [Pyrinomonadaceae bacterium]